MINRRGVKRSGKKPLTNSFPWPTKVPDYNSWSIYIPGDVVWFGELQYKAKDFVTGEQPDESPNWEIYVRIRK